MNAYTVVRDSDRLPLGFATSESEASAVALMMKQAFGEKVHIEIRDAEELIAEQMNALQGYREECACADADCWLNDEDNDLDIDEDDEDEDEDSGIQETINDICEDLVQKILRQFGLD